MKKVKKANSIKDRIDEECSKVSDKEIKEIASNYLTVDQVKNLLHFKNKQTVYNLVQSGKLKATKLTGKLLFDKDDLLKWINK